jgi:hypothetical protein
MRSSRAVLPVAKLLILLALGALPQISAGEAATRCPSGQILRVSLGVCVPKAQNLAILAKHGTKMHKPAEETDEDAGSAPMRKPDPNEAANADRPDGRVEVAGREAAPLVDQSAPRPAAPPQSSPLSPFGALFVGAFHSSLSAGMSAFR